MTQGQITPFAQRLGEVKDLLGVSRDRIAKVLPKHLTPERMLTLATTEIQRTPLLLECDIGSIIGAVVAASELGLEFGARSHAHLVPYRIRGRRRCQLLIDYRGMAMLAEQHPDVRAAWAYVVRADDEFAHELGTEPKVVHRPSLSAEPDPDGNDIVAAYGVVDLHTGRQLVEVLPRWEIDKVRASSRASDDGPWVTWYERQARKTALRRVLNLVSSTGAGAAAARLANAVRLDEAAERGKAVVEIEPEPMETSRAGGSVLDNLADELEVANGDAPNKDPNPEISRQAEQAANDAEEADAAWDPFDRYSEDFKKKGERDETTQLRHEVVKGLDMLDDQQRHEVLMAYAPQSVVDLPPKSLREILAHTNRLLNAAAVAADDR